MDGQELEPPAPPLAVLDTNTLLDLLLFQDPRAAAVLDAIVGGRLRWMGTPRMRAELLGVLRRPALGRWQTDAHVDDVQGFVARWMHERPAPAISDAPRCRHGADQIFIDLAWHTRSNWLLTRDKALLKLARAAAARGLRICVPERFDPAPPADPG